jgi:lactate dehydrogenase-like 2-hydroxyacid dehydrogenase
MPEPVIVTEKEHVKAAEVFARASNFAVVPAPADEAALAAAVTDRRVRAVIIGIERYTGPLYHALHKASAGRGAIIARFGVGHDGVDKALARENGIVVCNTPGALDASVAEHTLWLMGNLARRISQSEARLRAGDFSAETGSELCGKRLGVLGLGAIGRRVAAMANYGLCMNVWAAGTRTLEELEAKEDRSFKDIRMAYGLERYTNDADQLLSECDFLSIHLPATAATRHFVNARRFGLMKPTAVLINTARGSIVDEIALYEALEGGKLAGAALDVFETEPYQPAAPEKDLRRLANLVLTPHIGSNTRAANRRMAEACLANLGHFFGGELDRMTRVS